MKQTINFSQFLDAFSEERKNTFTYEGKKALYDYLIDYEESTGEEIELDTIALCCEYTEYQDADDASKEYFEYEGMTYDNETGGELKTVDQVMAEALEFLEDRTQVIKLENGGIIIQNF